VYRGIVQSTNATASRRRRSPPNHSAPQRQAQHNPHDLARSPPKRSLRMAVDLPDGEAPEALAHRANEKVVDLIVIELSARWAFKPYRGELPGAFGVGIMRRIVSSISFGRCAAMSSNSLTTGAPRARSSGPVQSVFNRHALHGIGYPTVINHPCGDRQAAQRPARSAGTGVNYPSVALAGSLLASTPLVVDHFADHEAVRLATCGRFRLSDPLR